MERAVDYCQGETLTDFDLNIAWEMGDEKLAPPEVSSGTLRALQPQKSFLPYTMAKQQVVETFDKDYITQLLYKTKGNVTEAAAIAVMEPSNFRRLMRRYGFRSAQFVKSVSS